MFTVKDVPDSFIRSVVTTPKGKAILLNIYDDGFECSNGFHEMIVTPQEPSEDLHQVSFMKKYLLELPVNWFDITVNSGHKISGIDYEHKEFILDDGTRPEIITID